ncbi:hypothetical protein ATANTOWER_010610 [Ataeniobius toweri]|uniref:Reverse transcriptase domain-containing protein n=1 Tax=Ataeniobius toweri TaxID=208326 RepID=A0ABU7C7H1_9TELE|nr:hypothetical protein [Ataeniobius toweri]
MKVLERLRANLSRQTSIFQTPTVCCCGVPDKDAIIHPLLQNYYYLEKAGSTVWIMLFDLASRFNRIQSYLLCQNFLKTQVDYSKIMWINDYLTNRPPTEGLCVRPGSQHHRSTTGDSTLTITFSSVQFLGHDRFPG